MLDFSVWYTSLQQVQRVFAIFYAGFPQGALEKSMPMRLPALRGGQ
jgi:hypothetical protein